MNEKIIEMIVQLSQQGGSVAVWMFGIHVAGGVLKFAIAFGCILAGIHKLSNVLRSFNHAKID